MDRRNPSRIAIAGRCIRNPPAIMLLVVQHDRREVGGLPLLFLLRLFPGASAALWLFGVQFLQHGSRSFAYPPSHSGNDHLQELGVPTNRAAGLPWNPPSRRQFVLRSPGICRNWRVEFQVFACCFKSDSCSFLVLKQSVVILPDFPCRRRSATASAV